MAATGVLLCGVAASIEPSAGGLPVVIGSILGLTGFGGERQVVPNVHNDNLGGWTENLVSCIRTLKPFRISLVYDTNSIQWKTWLAQTMQAMAIVWPVEKNYATGGTVTFQAAVTDYTAGSADIQGRINAEMTITPSGEPTITPGTPVAS